MLSPQACGVCPRRKQAAASRHLGSLGAPRNGGQRTLGRKRLRRGLLPTLWHRYRCLLHCVRTLYSRGMRHWLPHGLLHERTFRVHGLSLLNGLLFLHHLPPLHGLLLLPLHRFLILMSLRGLSFVRISLLHGLLHCLWQLPGFTKHRPWQLLCAVMLLSWYLQPLSLALLLSPPLSPTPCS